MTSKIAISMLAAGAVALGLTTDAHAIPIDGSLWIANGWTDLNGPASTATAGSMDGGIPDVYTATGYLPTGAFSTTAGTFVNIFQDSFTFSPTQSPSPINDFLEFKLDGVTYSFNLTSISSSVGDGGQSLTLTGTGVFSIVGGSTSYDPTLGTVTINMNPGIPGPGYQNTNGTELDYQAEFVASGVDAPSVPEIGSTAILLGSSLAALAAFGKYHKQAAA